MASNESLVPKNHFTVDLSKGKFKEEFTLFVFFTLFVSLETSLNTVEQPIVYQIMLHMSFLEAKREDFARQIMCNYGHVFLLMV